MSQQSGQSVNRQQPKTRQRRQKLPQQQLQRQAAIRAEKLAASRKVVTARARSKSRAGQREPMLPQLELGQVSQRLPGLPQPLLNSSEPLSSKTAMTTPADFGPSRSKSSGLVANLLLQSLRLIILGIGVAAIAGTALSLLPLGSKRPAAQDKPSQGNVPAAPGPASQPLDQTLQPGKELTNLKQKVSQLIASQSELTAGVFFYNPDTGAYLNLGGDEVFSAASTIKIPVLVALFQEVDAGQIRLNEPLVMRPDLIASEAGVIQYQPPGTKFSALEIADLMITISDNTATNMLIDRLGGAAALNQRFRSWGLKHTVIQNLLPDLQGTNTTSAKDLATLMLLVGQGELVSLRSRDRLLEIMRRTVTDTLLPQGLETGAIIAHKTGDIGTYIGDAGLIDMPDGQRYVAAVMVKRPYNDIRGRELIQQISRAAYQTYKHLRPQPPAAPAVKPLPSPQAAPATAP